MNLTPSTSSAPLSCASRFELGDYVGAAQQSTQGDWQRFAALGIAGKTDQAISGLSLSNSSEARFYAGVALWIGGQDLLALKALQEADTPRARRLAQLISKEQINVLSQFPWPITPHYFRDAKFKVRNIGHANGDLQVKPFAPVAEYQYEDFIPDFYAVNMIEWHDIPCDIRDLGCPIFGTTSDYDAHIQNIGTWLLSFDQIITACSSAWSEVRSISGNPVVSFPKVYGIEEPLPLLNTGERPNDMFMSGFIWHPFNRDKTSLLHEVLKMNDRFSLNCKLGVGQSRKEFYDNLNSSKATWSFVRRADEVPTRALESLALGCAVVVQRESALNLYASSEHGIEYYDRPEDLPLALERIIDNWPTYRQRARAGAAVMRKEWLRHVTISQFLRFMTFLASEHETTPKKKMAPYLPQKDFLFLRGARPSYDYQMARQTILLKRISAEVAGASVPHGLLDAGRELIMTYARYNYGPTARIFGGSCSPKKEQVKLALNFYDVATKRFANALIPRFNSIRVALHFGKPGEAHSALKLAKKVLATDPNYWLVDLLEDVFPFDFISMYFNYRSYLDLVSKQLIDKQARTAEIVRLVLASIHSYLGHYVDGVENFRKATLLDPEFDYYQLCLAKALIADNVTANFVEAGKIVVNLAERSVFFLESMEIIEQLESNKLFFDARIPELRRKLANYNEWVQDLDDEDWTKISLVQPSSLLGLKD